MLMRLFTILSIITALVLLISMKAYGKEYRLLDVDEASFEYARIADHRDFFYTEDQQELRHRMAFNLNLQMFKYMYWNNTINMLGTEQQIRGGGWEFENGLHVTKYLDFFYYHLSQHIFERERPDAGYPLYNRVGVRIIFLKK